MKLAFTSCMDATRIPEQPIWKQIRTEDPDILILTGDAIYMDWRDIGTSRDKRRIRNGSDVFNFAKAMHERYAAQASVECFTGLIRDMRRQGKQVHIVWDDHDFAWNNATCVAPPDDSRSSPKARDEWRKHGVEDPQVRRWSSRLFAQFVDHLMNGGDTYPALAAAEAISPDPIGCIRPWSPVTGSTNENIDLMMLDTRWFRSPRQFEGSTILGPAQCKALVAAVEKSDGLLIVAGGSPMRHRYLLGEQDWSGGPSDEYQEFPKVLHAARRPVLYLSGDVHYNAWGGMVKQWADVGSQIIQILASPAAIDHLFFKEYPCSYGLLEVDTQNQTVDVSLKQFDAHRGWVLSPGEPRRTLRYQAEKWRGVYIDGEASEDAPWLHAKTSASGDMPVLCCVPLQDDERLEAPLDDLQRIDRHFKHTTINASGGPAGPSPVGPPLPLIGHVDAARGCFALLPCESQEAVMERAFDRALANGTSVVLFIHGAGKTPIDAIDQAYGLRALYECEPIVFSWPVGATQRRFGALLAPGRAAIGIEATKEVLRDTLTAFSMRAHRHFNFVPSIILARSAGAEMLRRVLGNEVTNPYLPYVRRIVLSAPACSASNWKASKIFDRGNCPPTYVTVNQQDRTLRLIDTMLPGEYIGAMDPQRIEPHDAVRILEFKAAGSMHDYFLLRLSEAQHLLHKALLTSCDVHFDPSSIVGASVPNRIFSVA